MVSSVKLFSDRSALSAGVMDFSNGEAGVQCINSTKNQRMSISIDDKKVRLCRERSQGDKENVRLFVSRSEVSKSDCDLRAKRKGGEGSQLHGKRARLPLRNVAADLSEDTNASKSKMNSQRF